jgi:hypothetical protein
LYGEILEKLKVVIEYHRQVPVVNLF